MKNWFQQWLVVVPGVFLAAYVVDGITFTDWRYLLLLAAVLGAFNIVLKPLLILFALPFVIFTFGLGIIFINALLLLLAGEIVPGFAVSGFWAAFWGGVLISLGAMVASTFLGDRRWKVSVNRNGPRGGGAGGRRVGPSAKSDRDVIDI